jgi:hypothetical protein
MVELILQYCRFQNNTVVKFKKGGLSDMEKNVFDTINALLFLLEYYHQEPKIDDNGMITAEVINPEDPDIFNYWPTD